MILLDLCYLGVPEVQVTLSIILLIISRTNSGMSLQSFRSKLVIGSRQIESKEEFLQQNQ